MKFTVMQRVYIQSDTFNFGAPIGETGFIARVDRSIDQAQPYLVRVPTSQKWYWMPECDLVSADEWDENEVDQVIRQSLIDRALDTHDEVTFVSVTRRGE